MKADSYRFDGSGKCRLDKLATNSKADGVDKEKILAKTAENLQKMAALQDAFYADGREGLIFVLQAMDAAGKDSTIKHVMSGLNPQGVQVTSFKQPNSEELKHDFLWRVNKALPARGSIAIFNRSYYEDVLVVQLHDLQKGYQMAPRVLEQDKDEFFAQRYRQIRHYEQYLYENSRSSVKQIQAKLMQRGFESSLIRSCIPSDTFQRETRAALHCLRLKFRAGAEARNPTLPDDSSGRRPRFSDSA